MFRSLPSAIAIAFAGIYFAVPMQGQAPPQATPVSLGTTGAPDAQRPQDSGGITTLHARSNLVVIDVVVSDSKQNPVHGLKKEDFTLMENGKPQMIKNFEEHTALPASETSKVAPAPKLPPGLFTNKSSAPENGPVNVLLLDYLNTPLTAQPYARKQLMEYLDKAPAGTRIAIFGLTTQLIMLQGFTSDPGTLKAALTTKKGVPRASDILTDPVNGGPQGNTTLSDNFSSDALDAGQQLANLLRTQALETAFEQDLRTKVTLSAFDLLARYLVGIPGRKNVVWFSGSFPLSVEPNTNLQDAFDAVVRNDDEVRKTDNMLTRAQIAVYPVDARGVFNDPANSAVNGGTGASGTTTVSGSDVVQGSIGSAGASAQMDFLQQTGQEHETMFAMADDTGGHAFINTNNLAQAVAKAIENGSNYYTLTYTPTNAEWDGKFRAIKVKVEQPGVKLSYRNGYYADDPNDRNRLIAGVAATALVRPTTMATAMMRGGPDPSEILFKVRIRPAATPPEEQPVQGNRVNPDPKVKAEGPYKEYGVDLVPDHDAISCPLGANGNRRCALEVATYVYDRDGQLIVTNNARTSATLSPESYAKMLVSGMAFHQEISVPVKGEYYVRTAIHDLTSDRVGAVEVPIAAVAHLQPLEELPPGPAPMQVRTTSTSAPVGALPAVTTSGAAGTAPSSSTIDLKTLMPGLADPAPAPAASPAPAATPSQPAAPPK
jgi:VWFA-related protein